MQDGHANSRGYDDLKDRYASKEMVELFSIRNRVLWWRKLWVVLAECEKELGLNITDEQIQDMYDNLDKINWDIAAIKENEVHHDVIAHIYAFAMVASKAAPIIHLGATSCYVTDNTDLILMREALRIIAKKLIVVIRNFLGFIDKYKNLPTIAYTHYQEAQPTTVGKRASLWAYDFLIDLMSVVDRINNLPLLGCMGTTGTQASFMKLFNDDYEKVLKLNDLIKQKLEFNSVVPVSGQTYTRKIDAQVLSTLGGIASSASKFANDIRLLMHDHEIEEDFGKAQIGSSAMPYKRNPMYSERICGLSRYLIGLPTNLLFTHASQWLERTLDDSSNRRIVIPQAFMVADAILEVVIKVINNIVVNENVIKQRLLKHMEFVVTENLLIDAVKSGGNRQVLHSAVARMSKDAIERMRMGWQPNLIESIKESGLFNVKEEDWDSLLDPVKYVGCAPQQTEAFIKMASDICDGIIL